MTLQEMYGPRIKLLRAARKEVQADLAAALDVSRSHIANIENGKDAASLETLLAIAAHYGTSLDWLVHGHGGLTTDILTTQERRLLSRYRELPPQARENALKLFEVAVNLAGVQEEGGSPA